MPEVTTVSVTVRTVGVTLLWPQTLLMPEPAQVAGAVQVPHEATARAAPQLSLPESAPQSLPWREQNSRSDSGVHPSGAPASGGATTVASEL